MTHMTAVRRRPGRIAIQIGIGLLWFFTLMGLPLEFGDCFGSEEQCAQVWAIGGGHIRLVVLTAVVITILGILALRSRRPIFGLALLASAVAVVVSGVWLWAAGRDAPTWIPIGSLFTAPAGIALVIGALRRLTSARRRETRSDPRPGRRSGELPERRTPVLDDRPLQR